MRASFMSTVLIKMKCFRPFEMHVYIISYNEDHPCIIILKKKTMNYSFHVLDKRISHFSLFGLFYDYYFVFFNNLFHALLFLLLTKLIKYFGVRKSTLHVLMKTVYKLCLPYTI